jgi:hypothetical protein
VAIFLPYLSEIAFKNSNDKGKIFEKMEGEDFC